MASAIFLFRISPEIVTELCQLSLRGYDNRRYRVTAIVASGLRQSSLRGYGNRRYGVTIIVTTKQINTDAPKHRE